MSGRISLSGDFAVGLAFGAVAASSVFLAFGFAGNFALKRNKIAPGFVLCLCLTRRCPMCVRMYTYSQESKSWQAEHDPQACERAL